MALIVQEFFNGPEVLLFPGLPGGPEILVLLLIILGFTFVIRKIVSGGGTSKYCQNCQQNVNAAKGFSWVIFLLLLIFGLGIGALLYVGYYFIFKSKTCPICGDQHFSPPRRETPSQVDE
jgi:hypothetical protein